MNGHALVVHDLCLPAIRPGLNFHDSLPLVTPAVIFRVSDNQSPIDSRQWY